MSVVIDEIGNSYSKLTVLSKAGRDKHGHALWACVCECGNTTIALGTKLRSGRTKSCGCLWKLPEGEANFNILYWIYERNAKRKNLPFMLSKEKFKELTSQCCYYCGAEPRTYMNDKKCNGAYVYNGLDRTDNTKGYTRNNIVPCCAICNSMKGTMFKDEFLFHVSVIFKYNKEEV